MQNKKSITTRKGQMALEWIIMSTILAFGLIAAAAAVRDSISVETAQAGNAAGALNQNFSAPAVTFTGRGYITYTISGSSYSGNEATTIRFGENN